jgi:hypothetical protein
MEWNEMQQRSLWDVLTEREEWGREHKGNNRGNADNETDGMKRNAAKKSMRCPDEKRGMGQRAQRQQQRAKQPVKRMEWNEIDREDLETCCWKERNGQRAQAESAKATTGAMQPVKLM